MTTQITSKQIKVVNDVNFNNNEIINAKIDANKNEIINSSSITGGGRFEFVVTPDIFMINHIYNI